VSSYQRRYPEMPRPVVDMGNGRCKLWLRSDILKWAKQTGRLG
jgi:glutathione-regulated potassium-efflux system ancillary protein KefG